MNVLFLGLGSIGLRNLRSCLRVRSSYEYAALRTSKTELPDDINGKISSLKDTQDAKNFRPAICFIASPTSNHLVDVRRAIELGATAIFLEKPACSLLEDIAQIKPLLHEIGDKFFYGCILRHSPLLMRTRNLLNQGKIGRPLSASIYCGSYLPEWRPGRDYRTVYSARRELGGGVSLDLIHEFDYAEFLFGRSASIDGFKAKVSDLEIDVDDICEAWIRHESSVLSHIHLNYTRRSPRRDFEIMGTQGTLTGNLLNGDLCLDAEEKFTENHFLDRDKLHDIQTSQIFDSLEKNIPSPWSVSEVLSLNEKVILLKELK